MHFQNKECLCESQNNTKKNGINIVIDINFSMVKLFMGDLNGCLINFVCILNVYKINYKISFIRP